MEPRQRGWLLFLSPLLLCLPCLAAPLVALGAGAALSVAAGWLMASAIVFVGALLVTGAIGGFLCLRHQRPLAPVCGRPTPRPMEAQR